MAPQKGKQATKGQKQIYEENKSTLKFYSLIAAVPTVIHALTIYFLYWDTIGTFNIVLLVFSIAVFVACHQFMTYMARACFGPNGQLLDGGLDLNMETGVAEHVKDLIILTAASQVLSLLNSYFWLLWLLGPIRAFYLLWVNILAPWIFQPAPEVDDKKQKKMERRAQRRH
uniref:Transmembrane protein 208 n=1 Tax=Strigamia maritima TaxID=126957 RepID=T1INZ6_STRMM